MANFQKHGENVNGRVLHTSPGKLYELGVWGPVDTRTMTELDVSIRPASALVTVKRAGMVPGQNVRIWQLIGLPVGQFVVEARDGGGSVWTSVTIDTTPQPQEAAAGGRKYTDNPNEQVTKRTTPTARDVVTMLMAAWSDLTQNGARTLAAQFMAETGSGRYCFNWNLGNVKAGPNEPHMYLRGVWEVDSVAGAQTQVANAGGLAHVASDDEIKKHGWGCRAGESIAVFDPPHPQCRFRAYGSLTEGAKRWLGRYQKIAQRNADFLTSLNNGDTAAVAHLLKQTHYYTADEDKYASAMARAKVQVDRELGPLQ